jgi:AbrB family looped-hinge helix DNA binding protein
LAETTYHENKIYVPADVREKLGLKPGEKLNIVLLDRRSFKVELQRRLPEEELEEELMDPQKVGVPEKLTRREIYDDIR